MAARHGPVPSFSRQGAHAAAAVMGSDTLRAHINVVHRIPVPPAYALYGFVRRGINYLVAGTLDVLRMRGYNLSDNRPFWGLWTLQQTSRRPRMSDSELVRRPD